ncbi:hypothetical protein FB45DRAFT_1029938 [Roridomyces roridus]|uniref:Uncharacterized protein n=1 Tax=Roridomyces roridus TaxID=1738132 RepID=A0AAD7BN72_9AGAR|nr:hypothetical protein FB45DRAFT_1029938 [Roridomyces roridus]
MAPYVLSFLYEQFTAKLTPTDADLAGRTFLVTGSNTGRKIHVWELDMADFASVKKFATRANAELERLDGAALNAGVNTSQWTLTTDGWERTLQVNALATGLLAILLLPLLQKTAGLPALSGFAMVPHLTITGSSCKLFNVYLARKIAGLEQAKGIVVNVVNPGLCSSELARDIPIPSFALPIIRFVAWSCAKGSLNLLYSLLNGTPSGSYVTACAVSQPPRWTLDESGLRVQERVWNEMVELWRTIEPGVDGLLV